MYTSFFSNKLIDNLQYFPVKISIGHPRFKLRYRIELSIPELYPNREWFELSPEEYALKYLFKLEDNTEVIFNKLKTLPDNAVFLCFEKLYDNTWCHRSLFADWYKEKTDIEIPELRHI